MRILPLAGAPLFCVLLACGSSTPARDVANDPNATDAEPAGNDTSIPPGVIDGTDPRSKAVQHAQANSASHADLSVWLVEGGSDRGGTLASTLAASANATFVATGLANLNALVAPYSATLKLDGYLTGQGTAAGSATFAVQGGPSAAPANLSTLVLTGNYDVTTTYANGDTLQELTVDPNVQITLVGTRQGGSVVRTLTGQVRRVFTSATDASQDFDYLITHTGTVVTDVYVQGALQSRTLEGSVSLANNGEVDTMRVDFAALKRTAPATCLCPSAGSATLTYPGPVDDDRTLTFQFAGTCGTSTLTADAETTATEATAQAVLWPTCSP